MLLIGAFRHGLFLRPWLVLRTFTLSQRMLACRRICNPEDVRFCPFLDPCANLRVYFGRMLQVLFEYALHPS